MDTLRRRIPFRFSDSLSSPENSLEDTLILDEQEQDELIEKLRAENTASNTKYSIILQVSLILSASLQSIYLLGPSKENPLLIAFPPSTSQPTLETSIPLSRFLTFLMLLLHLNLALLLRPSSVITYFPDIEINPIPYNLCYALAAVAPTLCLFLGRPWQTTAWWCFTSAVIFIVQTVQDSIVRGNESISELEAMKYTSPGA